MFKKVQLFKFIFDLERSEVEPEFVTGINCHVQGQLPAQLSGEDLKEAMKYQQRIFEGEFNWLINKDGLITLPTHNILVTLVDPIHDGSVRYGGGSIQSCLKETCPHCQDTNCDFDCPESFKWQNIKDAMSALDKRAELESNRNYNYACDAIEALILAHAVAGVNIESPAYIDGLESAIDSIASNL